MAIQRGGVAERFKATVLKTVVLKGTVSSNLTPSATTISYRCHPYEENHHHNICNLGRRYASSR